MSRELIEALYDRVEHWKRDPGSDVVFGPAADAEVARLFETPGFAEDLEGRHAAGMLFWCRFLASGSADQDTFRTAVGLLEPIVFALPDAVPEQVREVVEARESSNAASDQAIACFQQYQQTGDLAQLDEAIDLMASAVLRLPQRAPAAATFRFNLGSFCWTRYRHLGDPDDLETAVEQFTEATAIDNGGGSLADAAPTLYEYAAQLVNAYEAGAALDFLFLAIQVQRCATQLTTTNQASYGAFLADLIQLAYDRTAQPELLDDAVATAEWALSLEPENGSALHSLAYSLVHRATTSQDADIAQQAVDLARRAAATTGDGRTLQVLGMALRTHHLLSGDRGALTEAVDVLRQAAAATDPADPDHVRRLMALADVLRAAADNPELATEAVTTARKVVAATSPTDPEYPLRRSIVVVALLKLHELADDPAAVEEAIALGRAAVRDVDPSAAAYPAVVRALALGLSRGPASDAARARTGEAIELVRDCLSRLPESHPEAANLRTDLAKLHAFDGHCRLTRFLRTTDDTELDRIVESCEAGSAVEPTALTDLCTALRLRFEAAGARADLDRSIEVGLQAVDALADDSDRLARAKNAVGFSLRLRYEQTEHLASLDDAIDLLQSAVEGAEAPDLRAALLNQLGNARWARHLRTGDPDELESAIDELRQSVRVGTEHDILDPGHLSNLGLALGTQYERTGEPAVLDEMVEVAQRAVQESRPDNHRLPVFQSNLGGALRGRYERDGVLADLDAAIVAHQQAIAAPTAGPLFRAAARANLGACWVMRFRRTDDPADLAKALSEYRSTARDSAATPFLRSMAAAAWGRLAAGAQDWPEALEGYAAALEQLPFVVPRFLDRSDQEHGLRQLSALGSDAAACALQAADAARAVELLDQGRAILLTQLFESHGDLSRLRAQSPTLATRFEQLRNRRNHPESRTTP
jgi:tetratricopeptide (TPR) repeat protein